MVGDGKGILLKGGVTLRKLAAIIVSTILAVVIFASVADASVHVRGYFRTNGTFVTPHYRSDPDGYFWNNWSTAGNYNPYTGKIGTRNYSGYGSSYRYYTSSYRGYYYTPSQYSRPYRSYSYYDYDLWGR